MSIVNAKKKKLRLVKPLLPIEPSYDLIDFKVKACYAEPTGTGNTLCLDDFFGRLFRADVEFVENCLKEFQDEYAQACKRMTEDCDMQRRAGKDPPIPQCLEVTNWNDLYDKLHLIHSTIGDSWGYTNSEDCQTDLIIDYTFHKDDAIAVKWGEPIFIFSPRMGSYPDPWYLDC